MNVSDKILSNLSSSDLSQNLTSNNTLIGKSLENSTNVLLQGFNNFATVMNKNILLLGIPATVIFLLEKDVKGLQSADGFVDERKIKINRRLIGILFLCILLNISGYFFIFVIDSTYLIVNNMIPLSWIFLIPVSIAFYIRSTILEYIRYLFNFLFSFHRMTKKLLHCISKIEW